MTITNNIARHLRQMGVERPTEGKLAAMGFTRRGFNAVVEGRALPSLQQAFALSLWLGQPIEALFQLQGSTTPKFKVNAKHLIAKHT